MITNKNTSEVGLNRQTRLYRVRPSQNGFQPGRAFHNQIKTRSNQIAARQIQTECIPGETRFRRFPRNLTNRRQTRVGTFPKNRSVDGPVLATFIKTAETPKIRRKSSAVEQALDGRGRPVESDAGSNAKSNSTRNQSSTRCWALASRFKAASVSRNPVRRPARTRPDQPTEPGSDHQAGTRPLSCWVTQA